MPLCPNYAGETFAGEPVEVVAGQDGDQPALVFTEGNFSISTALTWKRVLAYIRETLMNSSPHPGLPNFGVMTKPGSR